MLTLLVLLAQAEAAAAPPVGTQPGRKAVMTLKLPSTVVTVGARPLAEIRIQNMGTKRLTFLGELRDGQNFFCSLVRDGVPQRARPRLSVDFARPDVTSIVTLVPRAYFGSFFEVDSEVLGFDISKPGRYGLTCEFVDRTPLKELLAVTQRVCGWPDSDLNACVRDLTASRRSGPHTEVLPPLKATVEFEVVRPPRKPSR
ncbi:MAG TPA: hypothetical protein VGQ83_02680 [Polyangia bacterium]|jgi:hypothetical protein